MKNLFKKKSKQPVAPRAFSDIEKEYQQLSAQAASSQYQVYVHKMHLDNINRRLVQVNQEADARKKLDQEVQNELDKQKTGSSEATKRD